MTEMLPAGAWWCGMTLAVRIADPRVELRARFASAASPQVNYFTAAARAQSSRRRTVKEEAMMKRVAGVFLLCGALQGSVFAAAAEDFPVRPVRVVVPFAAGGTFDLVGRVVAQKLGEAWKQQVVVDNRPGGATMIATEIAVKSSPDGHTIYLSPNALAANPALHKTLPYDAKRDLQPVVLVAAQPMALGAHPTFKANSIRELLELAKAAPGKLSYGTAGIGSGGHLAGEIFKAMAG